LWGVNSVTYFYTKNLIKNALFIFYMIGNQILKKRGVEKNINEIFNFLADKLLN